MSGKRYISATEAAQRLGVRKATLYAYVSRGMIRSRPVRGTRAHEYARGDVEALLRGRRARRNPAQAAYATLSVRGLPVLRSGLSLIDEGRLYYRGHDAVALCRTHRTEDVASLLWGGWPGEVVLPRSVKHRRGDRSSLVARLQTSLAQLGSEDPAAASLQAPSVRRVGARMLRSMTRTIVAGACQSEPLAHELARAWCIRSPQPLDAALILCADHGLNVSAFTARCVASAGASIYMVVSAGLAALSGRRHGGHTARVAAMLDEAGAIARIVERHLQRDGEVPGFGHPLYPHGDPRAEALWAMTPAGPARERSRRFVQCVHQRIGITPSLDFALVTLCRGLGAPADAPFALFALGRTIGWVAHALEQYASGQLIRPRAEYIGPRPALADPVAL